MTTNEQSIHLGVLGASLVVAVWVFGAQWRATEPATHGVAHSPVTDERAPISIIPPGSAFLLSADLRTLLRSPLGAVIAERLGRSAGTSSLVKSCGFDPLTRLDQLALAVPSANFGAQEHPEDFGIVARGRFNAAEIARCAEAAIAARGGEAIRTRHGSFDSVRDQSGSGGEIASKNGMLVVSGGSYFRELLNSAESPRKPGEPAIRDLRHAELRRALGPGSLLATWLLGEGWFERVAGGDTNARLSPLSTLKALSARLNIGRTAELIVLLECADGESAQRISGLLSELRSSLDALPLDPALAGIATRIAVSQTGPRLRLELELKQTELSPVLDTLLGP